MECPRDFDCFGCGARDTLDCPVEDAYMEDIDYSKMNICGNCKNYHLHGVMGFDGQSTICSLTGNELEFDCSCERFERT